ncbi:MAG: hypothetical protein IJA60_03825 [Clostridia bacterium]|nr:hypothetical protein [Clostridia bacterium]
MSICMELKKVVAQQQESRENDETFKNYESANKHFKKLVEVGVASKRGYQLLPLESRMEDNIKINHKI